MKRNYQAMGMVAIAMGLWTSCAQTSVIDSAMETKGEIIGFSTYANKTRGVPTDNDGFKTNGSAFGVTAFINGTTPGITTPYMGTTGAGAQIKYTTAWDYNSPADARYWPTESETLDFYAYAPYEDANRGATPAMSKADGMKFTDYTVPTTSTTTPTPATDFAKQKDFMYASALGKTIKVSDSEITNGKLKLTFKHALTQILFKAKTNQSNLYVDIQENGIELCNIQNKGTFTLAKAATSTTPSWALAKPAVHANYTAPTKQVIAGYNNNIAVDLIKEQANTPDALMLMPQKLTAWTTTPTTAVPLPTTGGNSYLKIMCKIFTATKTTGTSGTADTYENQVYLHGSAAIPAGETGYAALYVPFSSLATPTGSVEEEAWKMGNKVTYTLIFGGGYDAQGKPILIPITFDTTVTPWTTTEANKDINL